MLKRWLEVAGLVVLYGVTHGWMLLNRGIYWDDWCHYHASPLVVKYEFWQSGLIWPGYLQSFLYSFQDGILLHRLIIFGCYLGAMLALWGILKREDRVSDFDRLGIVGLFMAFPVNQARIVLANIHFAIPYFLFFMAWLALSFQVERPRWWLRVLAGVGFFLSFFMNSILVFFGCVLVWLFWIKRQSFKRYPDFILLPILFWIFRNTVIKPFGFWAGYNSLSVHSLALSPFRTVLGMCQSFFVPLDAGLDLILSWSWVAVAAVVLVGWWRREDADQRVSPWWGFGFGVVALIAAIFPYAAVGSAAMPDVGQWFSRHQTLVPLGAALILVYGVRGMFPSVTAQRWVIAGLLSVCMFATIGRYVELQKDWFKQVALIEWFKSDPEIRAHHTFLIADRAVEFNANERFLRPYEYGALFYEAFGDQTRFGMSTEDHLWERGGVVSLFAQYRAEIPKARKWGVFTSLEIGKMKDYVPAPFDYQLTITPAHPYPVSFKKTMVLALKSWVNPPAFRQATTHLITIKGAQF